MWSVRCASVRSHLAVGLTTPPSPLGPTLTAPPCSACPQAQSACPSKSGFPPDTPPTHPVRWVSTWAWASGAASPGARPVAPHGSAGAPPTRHLGAPGWHHACMLACVCMCTCMCVCVCVCVIIMPLCTCARELRTLSDHSLACPVAPRLIVSNFILVCFGCERWLWRAGEGGTRGDQG